MSECKTRSMRAVVDTRIFAIVETVGSERRDDASAALRVATCPDYMTRH